MKNDQNYQVYSMCLVKDVPTENLEYLIKLFINKASVNMGVALDERKTTGCIEIIKTYYPYIPVHYVASGIIKGSLGHYGAGYLVPRTVYLWMNEISREYNADQAKKALQNSENGAGVACDLHKFPAGRAICAKIEWYRSGKISGEDWDRIPLQKLAQDISSNRALKIENYL